MNKIILSILIAFISCINLRKTAEWNFETFQKELVARHNEYRKKHAASSLTILKDLTILCQKTVDNCKKIGRLHHRDFNLDDGTLVGQNLYFTNSTPTGIEVADNWYSEIEYYDYNGDKIEEKTSHFTQMVWKNTKQIGCAVAVGPSDDSSNNYYIGCDYLPAGNILGQYSKNVSPPTPTS